MARRCRRCRHRLAERARAGSLLRGTLADAVIQRATMPPIRWPSADDIRRARRCWNWRPAHGATGACRHAVVRAVFVYSYAYLRRL